MSPLIFIFASAFLFNIIAFGDTALQCYHCDMKIGNDCDNPIGNNNLIANCSAERNETTCYIHTMMAEDGSKKIHRGCGTSNPCISGSSIPIPNDTSICTKCDENLCNGKKNTAFSNFNLNLSTILLSSIMYFCVKKLI